MLSFLSAGDTCPAAPTEQAFSTLSHPSPLLSGKNFCTVSSVSSRPNVPLAEWLCNLLEQPPILADQQDWIFSEDNYNAQFHLARIRDRSSAFVLQLQEHDQILLAPEHSNNRTDHLRGIVQYRQSTCPGKHRPTFLARLGPCYGARCVSIMAK
jgi:hypothetical protein